MCKTIQFGFCFVLLLLILHDSLADTKDLRDIVISDEDFTRVQRISLKNADSSAEELVNEGSYDHYYHTNEFGSPVLRQNYLADKNDYYAKYTYDNDPYRITTTDKPETYYLPPVNKPLNPSTLKSLGG